MTEIAATKVKQSSDAVYPRHIQIFFGHQSVGLNILDGIRTESPTISIVDLADRSTLTTEDTIFHARIGENFDPMSKIAAFSDYLATPGLVLDMAMMKFCYVDITQATNIENVFQRYVEMVDTALALRPSLRLIHMTVPLRTIRLGVRSFLKMRFGRIVAPIEDNLRRESFNSLLRSEYGLDHGFFDLAAVESTKPNGRPSLIRYRNMDVQTLYPGYSNDGGHLNDLGRRTVAKSLMALVDALRTE